MGSLSETSRRRKVRAERKVTRTDGNPRREMWKVRSSSCSTDGLSLRASGIAASGALGVAADELEAEKSTRGITIETAARSRGTEIPSLFEPSPRQFKAIPGA